MSMLRGSIIRIVLVSLVAILMAAPAAAQLRGHGGPVRAVTVSRDGKIALSGSFDTSAIRWSLEGNVALQVLRFHESAVNAVAMFADSRMITAGEDGQIGIWRPGASQPQTIFKGHTAPIVSVAIAPDGASIASASWDRTVRIWPLAGGPPRILEGHTQNVNSVAFMPDNHALVSAGYDATVRIWPLDGGNNITTMLPTPLNAVAVVSNDEIVAGGANGQVFFVARDGEVRAEIQAMDAPIISLAVSPNHALIAAAGVRGSVAIIDSTTRKLLRTLVGPGLPVWSVAFFPDSATLLTGGTDRIIRRWSARTGDSIDTVPVGGKDNNPLAVYAGNHGAEIYRACIACHTLSPDEGNRAGPSLAGIFGRKIASLPGYRYSEALKKMDIIWTPETVSKLLEIGPSAYTPGTKMPEQTISSAEDRKALMDFLRIATTKK